MVFFVLILCLNLTSHVDELYINVIDEIFSTY